MKSKKPQTFTERLRQLAQASGMTQGELARRADVSPQVVSRLLAAGNSDVSLSIACRLAWAMGKSISAFEDAVREEWNMQPQTLERIAKRMSAARGRQKLTAKLNRIAQWEAELAKLNPPKNDPAGQATRRWLENMIHYWRQQATALVQQLEGG